MSLLETLIEDQLLTPPLTAGVAPNDYSLREIWICRRKDGGTQAIFGSGTLDDPYDGSTSVKFDTVMREKIPKYSLIRFGAGEFETEGGAGNGHAFAGFQPKAGWRMIGAGMFQTTLKLVNATGTGQGIPIIGAFDLVNGLEVSDLTLDCNLPGQPNSSGYDYARIMVQGIAAAGSDIVVRRVRVINWGTQTPLFEYGVSGAISLECFPIFVGGGGNNAVIDDCIVEQPSPNPARETTCLSAVSTNAVIRNCLVNGTINGASTNPVSISNVSITALSGTPAQWRVTLDFDAPHNKTASSRILLVIYKDGNSNNPLSGYFKVETTPPTATRLSYIIGNDPGNAPVGVDYLSSVMVTPFQAIGWADGIIEGNRIIGCAVGGPYHDTWATREIIVRNNYYRDVQTAVRSINGATDSYLPPENFCTGNIAKSGAVATFTVTSGVVFPLAGEWVEIVKSPADAYCGVFQVTTVASNSFSFTAPSGAPASGSGYTAHGPLRMGTVTVAGSGNHNREFAMASPHYVELGRVVEFFSAPDSSGHSSLVGRYYVTYIDATNAGVFGVTASGSDLPAGGYWFVIQSTSKSVQVEDNIIDLGFKPKAGWRTPPIGVSLVNAVEAVVSDTGPWTYEQVIVRGNLIRHVDGASDPAGYSAVGVQVSYARTLIAENNVVTLEPIPSGGYLASSPINYRGVKTIKGFNNQNSAGQLAIPWNWVGLGFNDGHYADALETDAEDAILMYLLNK
jgi:hypothetical protein